MDQTRIPHSPVRLFRYFPFVRADHNTEITRVTPRFERCDCAADARMTSANGGPLGKPSRDVKRSQGTVNFADSTCKYLQDAWSRWRRVLWSSPREASRNSKEIGRFAASDWRESAASKHSSTVKLPGRCMCQRAVDTSSLLKHCSKVGNAA